MATSALRKPSFHNLAKKKVSICLPPMHSATITSPLTTKERERRDRERERSRTLSVKSISTIQSSVESDHYDMSNRIDRFELRRLRHSTLLGLPSGFTFETNSFIRHQSQDWNNKLRINQEGKSISHHRLGRIRLHNAVPTLKFRVAVTCLVLNVLCPGLGTMIAAFSCVLFPCNDYMKDNKWTFFVWNIMISFWQVIGVVYLLIGYCWGIVWGIYMIKIAERGEKKTKAKLLRKKISTTLSNSSFWKPSKCTNERIAESEEEELGENIV